MEVAPAIAEEIGVDALFERLVLRNLWIAFLDALEIGGFLSDYSLVAWS